MSFKLQCLINIGTLEIRGGINEASKIKRGVKEIVDTGLLKIPAVGRIVYASANQPDSSLPTTSIETSKLWQEGDPITIQLGYNGDLRTEFKGFVRRVTASVPVEVQCEGYAWQLRRKRLLKSYKSVALKDFLKDLIASTDITLSPFIPDMTLTNLTINHANALKTLEYVKEKLHLSVYFQFDVLYVGLEEGVPGNPVKFRLGWNCVRDDNLKYRLAADNEVLVRLVTGKGKNNKRTLIEVGDPGGSLITKYIANITDQATLQAIANDLLQKAKYTGYEGYISGLLQPYCQPCDTAVIIDQLYNVMGGSCFVEAAEIEFTMKGATRKVHVSRALST
jgi:hypothetical protein